MSDGDISSDIADIIKRTHKLLLKRRESPKGGFKEEYG